MVDHPNDKSVIGIDLGTTNCVVGYFNVQTQQVEILRNSQGKTTT